MTTYDPNIDWAPLLPKLRELAEYCHREGITLKKIVIGNRMYPHFVLMTYGGEVSIEFQEYEDAKNRVHGMR